MDDTDTSSVLLEEGDGDTEGDSVRDGETLSDLDNASWLGDTERLVDGVCVTVWESLEDIEYEAEKLSDCTSVELSESDLACDSDEEELCEKELLSSNVGDGAERDGDVDVLGECDSEMLCDSVSDKLSIDDDFSSLADRDGDIVVSALDESLVEPEREELRSCEAETDSDGLDDVEADGETLIDSETD